MNRLLQPSWLDYSKLSVFGKSLFQPEYKILEKGFREQLPKDKIMRLFENQNEIQQEQISPSVLIDALAQELAKDRRSRSKEPTECNFYESADNVPDPKELSPEEKNLVSLMISCFRSRSVKHITFMEAFTLRLFVLESKLFQSALSNNSRKCKFLLSVS